MELQGELHQHGGAQAPVTPSPFVLNMLRRLQVQLGHEPTYTITWDAKAAALSSSSG